MVTYKVTYAGDTAHTAASATDKVAVSRAATALTLNNNGKLYNYGTDVKFTAHLGTAYKNRTVQIWADPFGTDEPKKLIKAGTVNSSGNISAWVDMTRGTAVTARLRRVPCVTGEDLLPGHLVLLGLGVLPARLERQVGRQSRRPRRVRNPGVDAVGVRQRLVR
ncbi:hypothetical protein ABZ092_20375 [Streptomyces bobili]|uniref:hypothetical protein n=1 Tax=Streptomyces bobili TaxID=67280 RepID=UPI0033B49258